jgi:hypothetical protein
MPIKKADCPPPVLLAMVMADSVQRDPLTRKFSILGAFDTISAPSFPCRHSGVAVYLSLTGGRGLVPFVLKLVDVDETRPPVLALEDALRFADPMSWVESSFEFHGPVFPEPGDYRFQFFAAGEMLRELRLKLRLVPKPGAQQSGEAGS